MADTAMSVANLLSNFASNGTHQIHADQLRNFVVTAMGVRGSLSVLDGSTQQDDPDTGAKITGWTTAKSNGITANSSTNDLTILVAGKYKGGFSCSFQGTNGSIVAFRVRVGGVEDIYGCTRRLSSTDTGDCNFDIPELDLDVDDVVTVYVKCDGSSDDFIPVDAQFWLELCG